MSEGYGRVQAELQKQLAIEISFQPIQNPRDTNENAAPLDKPADEQEYDFKLFSHADMTKKISLRDVKELSLAESGLVAQRPRSYYVAGPPDPDRQEKLQYSALTGEEVLRRAQRPNWGMAMPWRVITITSPAPVVRQEKHSVPDPLRQESKATSKRPGKKSRIALRKRRAAEEERQRIRQEMVAAKEKQKLEKEEHLREKKKRMNRLNKLRKKAKKQASKEGDKELQGCELKGDPLT